MIGWLGLCCAVAALSAMPLLAKDAAKPARTAPKSSITAKSKADLKTETSHVVQPGETLSGIAERAEVPRILIIETNRLKPPYTVKTGQKLVIPRRRSHTVKQDETGFDIAMDYGVPWDLINAANGLPRDAKVKPGQKLVIPTLATISGVNPAAIAYPSIATDPPKGLPDTIAPAFVWPVEGKLRRGFVVAGGTQPPHDGIDVLADEGTAVRAAGKGEVIFAGPGPEEYGLTVIIYHSGRWTTTYSYLSKITVKVGDKVRSGERIGLVGQTGLASKPQLHFEIRRNKRPLDPARYLAKR